MWNQSREWWWWTYSVWFAWKMKTSPRKLLKSLEKYWYEGVNIFRRLLGCFYCLSVVSVRKANADSLTEEFILVTSRIRQESPYGWSRKNMLAASFHEYGFHKVPLVEEFFMSILQGPAEYIRTVRSDGHLCTHQVPWEDPRRKNNLALRHVQSKGSRSRKYE